MEIVLDRCIFKNIKGTSKLVHIRQLPENQQTPGSGVVEIKPVECNRRDPSCFAMGGSRCNLK